MANAKITEINSITETIYPQVSAGISSSTLVDMSQFNQACFVTQHGTATTASTFVVKVYESTAATWAGAVAVLLSTTTVSVTTASTTVSKVELKADDITEGKRYVGVYVTKTDTASSLGGIVIQSQDRYLG